MTPPNLPANEAERLADLYEYDVLDTASELVFNELAALAAAICGTRYAGISLIDSKRQWFKASYGVELGEWARDLSICGHAINEEELFEVPNTAEDPRFADNPALNGHPRFRFYAGSQLRSERNTAIGMLCVLDSEPGKLSEHQRQALDQLAHVVMSLLRARREQRLAGYMGQLLQDSSIPMYVKDGRSLRYLAANAAGLRWAGCTLEELRGQVPLQRPPEGDPARFPEYLQRLQAGAPSIEFQSSRASPEGELAIQVSWQWLTTPSGSPMIFSIVREQCADKPAKGADPN